MGLGGPLQAEEICRKITEAGKYNRDVYGAAVKLAEMSCVRGAVAKRWARVSSQRVAEDKQGKPPQGYLADVYTELTTCPLTQ